MENSFHTLEYGKEDNISHPSPKVSQSTTICATLRMVIEQNKPACPFPMMEVLLPMTPIAFILRAEDRPLCKPWTVSYACPFPTVTEGACTQPTAFLPQKMASISTGLLLLWMGKGESGTSSFTTFNLQLDEL